MELKEVTIYDEKLKFPSIYREEVFSKFDVLFVTMRLMGYVFQESLKDMMGAYGFNNYIIRAINTDKELTIEFSLFDGKVIDIVVTYMLNTKQFNVMYAEDAAGLDRFPNSSVVLNTDEDLLEELERLLVYI